MGASPSSQCGVLLVGPNGCGKGTQAGKMQKEFDFCHISTGDMLREHRAKGTEIGKKAGSFMDAGKLVPDELLTDMVNDKIKSDDCKKGYILDGYPRNLTQSQSLNTTLEKGGAKIKTVLNMQVPEDVVVERCGGRWIHKASGRTYHAKFYPPKVAKKDDVTGEDLYQRPDDVPEVVRKRFQTYVSQTAPILEFYKKAGYPVADVDATQKADAVWDVIRANIQAANKK